MLLKLIFKEETNQKTGKLLLGLGWLAMFASVTLMEFLNISEPAGCFLSGFGISFILLGSGFLLKHTLKNQGAKRCL